jgi:hypothetical protein
MNKENLKSTLKGVSISALLTLALSIGTPSVSLSQQGSSG